MLLHASFFQWIMGIILILSAIGVVSFSKPIYASLSFLLSLITLAAFYLQLSAEFIAIMQILIYAGAILVIFVFVIVLFQDAHEQIYQFPSKINLNFLVIISCIFVATFIFFGAYIFHSAHLQLPPIPKSYGSAYGIGKTLYLDFFFPFEAIILLFLVAIIGALYLAKKEK